MKLTGGALVAAWTTVAALAPLAAQDWPGVEQGAYVARDFTFSDGKRLEELRLHYRTLGEPRRDRDGRVENAVLILHGTTGSGAGFLTQTFAGELFGDGQLLDASEYYIVLPDAIGHGESSKPSDGLRQDFPRYTYDDMVRAQHLLLTEGLGVDHLRLVMGTSMGGMHCWVWGYMYPDFVDAILPLASLPVEIAGRNRMMRRLIIDGVRSDPDWNGGLYDEPLALRNALPGLVFMVSNPLAWQRDAPTRQTSEQMLEELFDRYASRLDGNDLIYQFDSSRDYDPSPHLGQITAPLLAINSADDQVNPPELGILERETRRVPNGRAIVLPISDRTAAHSTHSRPAVWKPYLSQLLDASARPGSIPPSIARETTTKVGPPSGSLFAVGGAMRDPALFDRFLRLAGGKDAPIVLIPTASGASSYGPTFYGLEQWRDAGATNVTLLHTNDPAVADTADFAQPIREAQAVWFSGGRQWRLADSYLETEVHRALEELLERGGVIGGSSAGATILGSFLARGDSQTNTIMIGDHLEGLGFLRNVAIDQHLLRRNRQFDLLEVVRHDPSLLGIGIDEDTAILVRGDRLEVLGQGVVAIYDTQSRIDSGGEFFFLSPGDRYDLARREASRPELTPRRLERVVKRQDGPERP